MKKLLIIALSLFMGCSLFKEDICGIRYRYHSGSDAVYDNEYHCYTGVSDEACNGYANTDDYYLDYYGDAETCEEYCEAYTSCIIE